MRGTVRWSSGISLFVLGFALSVTGIAIVRFTDVNARPWLYVVLVIAVLTALGGLILAMVRAKQWSD